MNTWNVVYWDGEQLVEEQATGGLCLYDAASASLRIMLQDAEGKNTILKNIYTNVQRVDLVPE